MANSEVFKKVLTDFFKLYHPRQVKKVDMIADEFKGQELKVMHILSNKYKVALNKIEGLELLEPEKPVIEETVVEEPINEIPEEVESEVNEDEETEELEEELEEDKNKD